MARSSTKAVAEIGELKRPAKPARRDRPPRIQPPKREPGYGRLQQLLREEILDGRIPAGSRLKVSDIIARFGTSTNPAREALQGLEGEGLVIITPNRGARVRLINEDLVRNIFDIRALLEPYILGRLWSLRPTRISPRSRPSRPNADGGRGWRLPHVPRSEHPLSRLHDRPAFQRRGGADHEDAQRVAEGAVGQASADHRPYEALSAGIG